MSASPLYVTAGYNTESDTASLKWLQRVDIALTTVRDHNFKLWPPLTVDEMSDLACRMADVEPDGADCLLYEHRVACVVNRFRATHDCYRRQDAATIFRWLAHERRGIDT